MRVRFAPSPTGYLHVGNLRTALLNFLWSRHVGGEFMLRIDDTDGERCRPEYEDSIKEDLLSLGLCWDLLAYQSQRQSEYDIAADILRERGRLYECYESPEELELQRRVNLSQGLPPIYDRSGMRLSDSDKCALREGGRRPHWRFALSDDVIGWRDHVRGDVSFASGHLSDPVLLREDGRFLYTLSSVVDDGEFGITHIVRGEDHVVNTAVQVDIFRVLGLSVPEFAHVPLLLDSHGKSLSKRKGSLMVRDLRGIVEGQALLSYLAHLGLSYASEGGESLGDLVGGFDIGAYGRAAPRYDDSELFSVNVRYMRCASYDAVSVHLGDYPEIDSGLWEILRGNWLSWDDVGDWYGIIFGRGLDFGIDLGSECDFLGQALDCLPVGEVGDDFFGVWVGELKVLSGRSGRGLFVPLRLALTGRGDGPELGRLLVYLGRDEIVSRLKKHL